MTYVSTPELLITRISFANEVAIPDGQDERPTSSTDFRFYEVSCYSARSREIDSPRLLNAGGRWREVDFMNFPVEDNALSMSTRQIGWEKRKRVKEATTATAITAVVVLASWIRLSIFPRIFLHFKFALVVVSYSLCAHVFPANFLHTFELFLWKLSSASIFIKKFELVRRELVLYLASCFPII